MNSKVKGSKSARSNLAVGFMVIAFLATVILATWDRAETTAIGGLFLGATFILVAGLGLFKKWGDLGWSDLLIGLFAGYMLWRMSDSAVRDYARSDLFLLLLFIGVWLLRPFFKANYRSMQKAWILMMLITTVVNLAASFYQMFWDSKWGLFVVRSETASAYVSGFFSHYNYMANFCMVSLLSVLGGLLVSGESRCWRVLSGVVVVGNVSLLVLSHSRGAFISTIIGLGVFILIALLSVRTWDGLMRSLSLRNLIVGILSCLLGALVWMSFLADSRGWFSFGNKVADSGRGDLSAVAIDQFFESPVFGGGSHSFEWRSIELWPENTRSEFATLDYVHQEYFQLLAEYGAIGLALMLLCFFSVLGAQIYLIGKGRRGFKRCAWEVASCAAIVAFSVQCFFSFTAHIPALLLSVVMVGALGFSASSQFQERKTWQTLIRSTLLLVIGSTMLAHSAKEYPAFVLYTQLNDTHEVDYSQSPERLHDDIDALAEVVEKAPSFQRFERLGLLSSRAYQASDEPLEQQRYLEQSREAYREAVELYPMLPVLRLNYARLLSWSGSYDEAEEHFDYAVSVDLKREFWSNAHWYYAEACFQRANELWFARRSGEALFYFMKSQELLKNAKLSRFSSDMPQRIEGSVQLLKQAGFEPIEAKRSQ